jgi:hypothetical protein
VFGFPDSSLTEQEFSGVPLRLLLLDMDMNFDTNCCIFTASRSIHTIKPKAAHDRAALVLIKMQLRGGPQSYKKFIFQSGGLKHAWNFQKIGAGGCRFPLSRYLVGLRIPEAPKFTIFDRWHNPNAHCGHDRQVLACGSASSNNPYTPTRDL